jgi:hypothetical protein
MADTNTNQTFGRNGITPITTQATAQQIRTAKKKKGWKDYLFYFVIIFLALITFGNILIYFEDPEERSARLAQPSKYEISVTASSTSAYSVDMIIQTNIPLPVKVSASISIKGQKPNDTYIGTSEFVMITDSEQTVTLDGKSENLPAGEYIAEVIFHPRWGAKEGSKKAKEIKEKIIGTAEVTLAGSGKTKMHVDRRNAAKKWVIENVIIGTPWSEGQFVQKLGNFSKSKADWNLHDAYYFPVADMTIIVNNLKRTVSIWRFGKASK